ncbi:chloride channel protein [Flavisolibacter nicotianae]|uniref:chloride channel protein n=1 Tax=Flavisolibacter nicotianae TaxID=2364882 RepID=UPI000EB4F3A2|nr:chloride channel protein [Flavisolibacter nicotianae]
MKDRWNGWRSKGKEVFDLLANNRIRTNALQAIPFWAASLLTGLIAVGYTKLFSLAETLLQSVLHWHRWTIFLLTPFCFLLAWLCVQLFAPAARGSGIPQVMAAIDLATPKYESKLGRLLSFRILITKIASSLLMVLGGGAIGREGPTIQIAGSVFTLIHRLIPKTWPRLSNQNFILTGAAAGLAAAFNTPLGGVVFAMEELARIHIRFFRTPLFSAVIISGLTAQAFLGPYLYLGFPDVRNLPFRIFAGVALSAIIAGLLGSLMCKLTLKLMAWKKKFSPARIVVFILMAGVFIAGCSFFFNAAILGSGKELMNSVLFSQEKYSSWHTVVVRTLGPIICFNVGAAGGVFAPSLAAGASIGSYLSGLFHLLDGEANLLVLSGMVGFLTGVTRTPFTSAILVLEMTDRHSVIFHLMVAALLSNIAALLVDKHSFYEQLKKTYVEEVIESKNEQASPVAPAAADPL